MKAFKKWFNENKETWPHSPHDENDCGMAWEAALEWVKSRSIKRLISVNEIEMELKGENREMDKPV